MLRARRRAYPTVRLVIEPPSPAPLPTRGAWGAPMPAAIKPPLYDERQPMAAVVESTEALVFVREYLRYRLGRWELVRSHVRKWPKS